MFLFHRGTGVPPVIPRLLMLAPASDARAADPATRATPADYATAYALCVEKTRHNIARLAARPTAAPWAADGDYFSHPEEFFAIGNWTSSFFTGMALLAFESTHDVYFLRQANRLADVYREKITRRRMDTMHDLGFLYTLYSVALHRITNDLNHRRTALTAADELAKRFSARGGYLQAWGRMDDSGTDYAGLAIVDSLMNLPLLFWAARETGSRFHHEIAASHAEKTRACFVRPDDSVYHAFRFAVTTGRPAGPANYAGHSVDSHWARGNAWGIHGFALAYRHTGDVAHLDAAMRLARRFAAQLDQQLIPSWDFAAPARNGELLRDTSAAAIAVCALDELTHHRPDAPLATLAENLLAHLCTRDCLDSDPLCPGILRGAQVTDANGQPRNVYASWGDYFFMEALARRLHGTASYW